MVTAGAMRLVLTYYLIKRVWNEKLLTGWEMVTALVLGTAIAIAAIGVLFQ